MIELKDYEVWFVTGSQQLYGTETLEKVAEHSQKIVQELSHSSLIPTRVVFKPVMTTPQAIHQLCLEANAAGKCVGLVVWMHTFSPAKMWIAGLSSLKKPFVHLHTQFNRSIPWASIDMDYMNLNQSAHGDREFGFIGTRLRSNRKVIVGYWQDADVQSQLGVWVRAEQQFLHVAAGLCVEGAEGLVHQDDTGPERQRAGNGHALLHAAGERVGVGLLKPRQAHLLDQLGHGLVPLRLRDAVDLQAVSYVLFNGQP